jgi:hypothetical protein
MRNLFEKDKRRIEINAEEEEKVRIPKTNKNNIRINIILY